MAAICTITPAKDVLNSSIFSNILENEELSIPVTAFCRKVNISASAYYAWHRGTIDLSAATLDRIDKYLKKYGF